MSSYKNLICLLIACTLILMAVSCVSAADLNQTDIAPSEPVHTDAPDADGLTQIGTDTSAPLTDQTPEIETATGNIENLRHDIRDSEINGTVNLNKDYRFENGDSKEGIVISTDNLTINGNNHCICGLNMKHLFIITGSNVVICNLTIKDTSTTDTGSIDWRGDNGKLTNCTFSSNTADNGGAVLWQGNNGIITNVNFTGNTARVLGGAIYITGLNNKVENCTFSNNAGRTIGEAVYVSPKARGWSVKGNFNNALPVADGSKINIDEKYFHKPLIKYVTDSEVDLNQLLITVLIKGGVHRIGNDIIYYGITANKKQFELVIKQIDNSEYTYEQHWIFQDFQTPNDILNKANSGDYHMTHTIIKTVIINSAADYENACHLNSGAFFGKYRMLTQNYDEPLLESLNIQFAKKMDIESKTTWNPSANGFDTIHIDGKGSKIHCTCSKSDEYKFVTLKKGDVFTMSNITVDGFNTAVENLKGVCILDHVTLSNNVMDYYFQRDWGAGILNTGECICTNCKFINNKAKNGGAIFNQGNLQITNCGFHGNYAYGEGDIICNAQKGVVMIDGKDCSNGIGIVHYAKSISADNTKWILRASAIASAVVGGVAGFGVGLATGSPTLGLAAGAAVGAGIGAITSAYIISKNYDVNYDRVHTATWVMIGDGVIGGIAGYIGGSFGARDFNPTSAVFLNWMGGVAAFADQQLGV